MKPIRMLFSHAMLGIMCAAYIGNVLAEPEQRITPYQPTLQPEKSFEELKNDLERAFRDFYVFCQHDDKGCIAMYRNLDTFIITDEGLSVSFKNAEIFRDNIRPSDIDFIFRIQYDEFAQVLRDGACANPESVDPESGNRHSIKLSLPRKINYLNFRSIDSFRAACDAMANMGLRYRDKELQEEVRFKELAQSYRMLKSKPALTEPQRKLVVQANSLTQDRKFGDAIERYRQLLASDPVVYPAAYYNMALLSAELRLYKLAIRHMTRYLMLMPEANDARAAQDKVYEWELKVERK